MLDKIKEYQPLLYDEADRERVGRWPQYVTLILIGISIVEAGVVLF